MCADFWGGIGIVILIVMFLRMRRAIVGEERNQKKGKGRGLNGNVAWTSKTYGASDA